MTVDFAHSPHWIETVCPDCKIVTLSYCGVCTIGCCGHDEHRVSLRPVDLRERKSAVERLQEELALRELRRISADALAEIIKEEQAHVTAP